MAAKTGDDFDPVTLPSDRALLPAPPRRGRRERAHAAWRPPLGPVRRTIREIGYDLITAGVVVLLFVAYQLWGTGLAEAKSQHKLKQQFQTAPPRADNSVVGAPTAPGPGPPEGSAIAHLVIKAHGLDIDKYVVEGVTDDALRQGPGHYPGTPMPGEPGNAAIAGHRTTFGAPFFDLDKLVPGDEIDITTKARPQPFVYVVSQTKVVKPTDVGVIANTPDNRLTLTTCNPRFDATTRLIVVAMLSTAPVAPPPTIAPPRIVVKAINLGTGNNNAWTPVAIYGFAALALWVLIRLVAHRSRRRWLPILAGIPLCCVPLWFVFENSIRLLPNNI